VFPAAPEQQAHAGSEWWLPDLNCKLIIRRIDARKDARLPDRKKCRYNVRIDVR